jgi:hypothetical protein
MSLKLKIVGKRRDHREQGYLFGLYGFNHRVVVTANFLIIHKIGVASVVGIVHAEGQV